MILNGSGRWLVSALRRLSIYRIRFVPLSKEHFHTHSFGEFLIDLFVVDVESQLTGIEDTGEDQLDQLSVVEGTLDGSDGVLRRLRPECSEEVQQSNDHRALRRVELSNVVRGEDGQGIRGREIADEVVQCAHADLGDEVGQRGEQATLLLVVLEEKGIEETLGEHPGVTIQGSNQCLQPLVDAGQRELFAHVGQTRLIGETRLESALLLFPRRSFESTHCTARLFSSPLLTHRSMKYALPSDFTFSWK